MTESFASDWTAMRALTLGLGVLAAACRPQIYDIDRMSDPLLKARYSCQYLLERTLATEEQKDADGVLRRRIADFAEPTVVRDGDVVRTTWAPGAIVVRHDGSRHHGACTMTVYEYGRRVTELSLDGRALPANFGR